MFTKMEVAAIHTDLDEDLKKYINKKIGRMDRFVPKKARESAHVEIKLSETKPKSKQKQYTCEAVLFLPGETITTKETTINMYAAIDIVETKLKNQLKKYKDKHTDHSVPRRLLNKVRSRRMR
jgi:putative sigma-54 modulation protein